MGRKLPICQFHCTVYKQHFPEHIRHGRHESLSSNIMEIRSNDAFSILQTTLEKDRLEISWKFVAMMLALYFIEYSTNYS